MANEPVVTIVGNVGGDPELRFTQGGDAVINFSLANTPRVKDGDQWKDGEAMWLRCTAWRDLAQNCASTLAKGMRVIVQGRLGVQTWQDKDGNDRTSTTLQVDAIGPELTWATAQVERVQSGQKAQGDAHRRQGTQRSGQVQQGRQQAARPAQQDPWAAAGGSQDPWGANEEPAPF